MNSVAAQLPPEGHLASVNGIEMYYEIHGEGSPLVLLHYFTETSKSEVGQAASPTERESNVSIR